MIFYALRSKKTGFYMPITRSGGKTFDEPRENCVPRLFRRKSDAYNALRWWLSGRWYAYRHPDWHDGDTKLLCESAPPSRGEQQVEIVALEVKEIPA